MPDFSSIEYISNYSYIIYKTGSNYIGFNTITKQEQFNNTTAHTTFNSVITAMNTAGGGLAFVKAGTYLTTGSINPLNNTGLIGESRNSVILRHSTNTSDVQMFRYWEAASGPLLTNFSLENMTLETNNLNGNGTGETDSAWISSGTKNLYLNNIYIKSFSTPTVQKIQLFLDTRNGTNNNENVQTHFCEFEGPAGGQDFYGCGMMFDCDISHNFWHDNTSQAIGIGSSYRSVYDDNRFLRTGKAIGFETECISNQLHDNILYITDGIKLSQEETTTNISKWNSVKNNTIIYGEGGIEDGQGIEDDISDNTIIRSQKNGISGAFVRSRINNNTLIDTNWGNWSVTINSVSSSIGGIICRNNTAVIPDADDNEIEGNTLIDTGVAFTEPTTGLSKNGNTGPIVIDTDYSNTSLLLNKFKGLVIDVVDHTTETLSIEAQDKIVSIKSNLEDNLKIFRNINTNNSYLGLVYDALDSAGVRATYGKLQMNILDNTVGSKDSYFSVRYLIADTLSERFYAYNNLIGFGASGSTSIQLSTAGISGGVKDFTFPNLSGEVATIAATQTLTNKTTSSLNNNLVGIAQNPVKKRWGGYQPITPSSGSTAAAVGRLEGILTNHVPTGPGTNTNTWDATEGLLTNLITTTTSNQNAGLVSPTGSIGILRRAFATRIVYRGKVDTVASSVSRLYFGVSSANAIPITDTPVANADSAIIVGFNSTDTNYQIRHNDGSGAATVTAITGPIAKNTSFHTIIIEWTAAGNVVVTFDGTAQTISTDLPATTTNLFFHCTAQNATGAIRTHSIKGVWIESEK